MGLGELATGESEFAMTTMTALIPGISAPPPPHDEESLYEIVNGERVELPPMSIYAVRIAFHLARKLGDFGELHDLGEAVHEGLFHLPLPEARNRRPDAAFVSYQRWPKGRPMPEVEN